MSDFDLLGDISDDEEEAEHHYNFQLEMHQDQLNIEIDETRKYVGLKKTMNQTLHHFIA